tara:strand:- start:7235 stop:7540 length:306 start_codon:yes stop_codon:yes gene_type:complete
MGHQSPYYLEVLKEEYEKRNKKNSLYSRRAFSAGIGVDFSQFCKILNRKLVLSVEMADFISKKLKLNPEQRKKFVVSAAEEKKCFSLNKVDSNLTECLNHD